MKVEQALLSSLNRVIEQFKTNELAYLALTSKIEFPIRDKWAFLLHEKLFPIGIIVAREWKRIDLAILIGDKPLALIQIKAIYTFDAAIPTPWFKNLPKKINADQEKAKKLANDKTVVYTMLLATHPRDPVPKQLAGIVKYHIGINKAIGSLGSADAVKKCAIKNIDTFLKLRACRSLDGGSALGINVEVLYWIKRV